MDLSEEKTKIAQVKFYKSALDDYYIDIKNIRKDLSEYASGELVTELIEELDNCIRVLSNNLNEFEEIISGLNYRAEMVYNEELQALKKESEGEI